MIACTFMLLNTGGSFTGLTVMFTMPSLKYDVVFKLRDDAIEK